MFSGGHDRFIFYLRRIFEGSDMDFWIM